MKVVSEGSSFYFEVGKLDGEGLVWEEPAFVEEFTLLPVVGESIEDVTGFLAIGH